MRFKPKPESAEPTGSKYHGFKGHFERDVFVFDSQDERDRWQVETYGNVRNGYREPEEPRDGRDPIDRRPFWRDESERLTYEYAVESNPRRQDESPMSYIRRLAEIAAEKQALGAPGKAMPNARIKATDERLAALRKQVAEITQDKP